MKTILLQILAPEFEEEALTVLDGLQKQGLITFQEITEDDFSVPAPSDKTE